MRVLSIVLTQLSIGSLLLTGLLPPRQIRLNFFTLNSLICALAAALALVLAKFVLGSAWGDVRFLGLTVVGATIAFGCFRLEKPQAGRLFLILSGLLGLLFGLMPLAGRMMALRDVHTTAPGLFDAGVMAGALLLGATNVGMILGHWYLLMRRLSFEYLERFSLILLGAVALRIFTVVTTLTMLRTFDPNLADTFIPALWSWHGNLFFFLMRILWGLALPAVLGVLVFRCVKAKANQAATGMLYVIEVSVLFGELFAAYLMI
jgi:hypothetical protein